MPVALVRNRWTEFVILVEITYYTHGEMIQFPSAWHYLHLLESLHRDLVIFLAIANVWINADMNKYFTYTNVNTCIQNILIAINFITENIYIISKHKIMMLDLNDADRRIFVNQSPCALMCPLISNKRSNDQSQIFITEREKGLNRVCCFSPFWIATMNLSPSVRTSRMKILIGKLDWLANETRASPKEWRT